MCGGMNGVAARFTAYLGQKRCFERRNERQPPHDLPYIWAQNAVLNGEMNGVAACFAAYQAEFQAAP